MTSNKHQEYIIENFINPDLTSTFNSQVQEDSESGLAMLNVALGLTGESGEFSDIIKKVLFHGHPLTPELKAKLELELGDIRFYTAWGAKLLGRTTEEIDQMNIDKLDARYPNKFSSKDSIERKETS